MYRLCNRCTGIVGWRRKKSNFVNKLPLARYEQRGSIRSGTPEARRPFPKLRVCNREGSNGLDKADRWCAEKGGFMVTFVAAFFLLSVAAVSVQAVGLIRHQKK